MDLNNNGTVEEVEFGKALEKVGINFPNKKDITTLFNYYDLDRSGALDYKEFTGMITQDRSNPMAK